jgi:hypothetical protein
MNKQPVRKPARPVKDALGFTTKQRLIFTYFDGVQTCSGDPLVLQRNLLAFPELSLEDDLKLMDAKLPQLKKEADEARKRVLDAVRHTFGIRPYREGEGLTELECFDLLYQFGAYLNDLKKKRGTSWTSSNPTPASASDASITPPVSD